MNLKDPTTCRILAILIRNIDIEDRATFRKDAEEAENIEEFILNMGKYKTVE